MECPENRWLYLAVGYGDKVPPIGGTFFAELPGQKMYSSIIIDKINKWTNLCII